MESAMVQLSARSPTAALITVVTILAFVLGTTTSGMAAGLNPFLRNPRPVITFLSKLPSLFERAKPPLAGAPETGFSATDKGIRTPGLVLPPYF
jgi:hypothetical protein